jgi:uncharacterized membrane protein
MFTSFLVLGFLASCLGCGPSGTPGGPGANGKTNNQLGTAEETFEIEVPLTGATLKQGESKKVSLSLDRGKNFDEDVTLKFDNVPKGVSIDPATPKIAKGDKETTVTLKAAEDAAIGDFTVNVSGEPTKGKKATKTLKVTVEKP